MPTINREIVGDSPVLNNHRFIYFGIMTATMLDSFAVGILLPVLPFIVLDLGENAFWVGALFSIQFMVEH